MGGSTKEYMREYMRNRYQTDEEFRDRVKSHVIKADKKRRKMGKTWEQQNPDLQYYYQLGYRGGLKRGREVVCNDCKKKITNTNNG